MNIGTLAGVVAAFGCILLSVTLEGGHLGAFFNVPAFLIVFGGTFGATLVSAPMPTVMTAMKASVKVVKGRPPDPVDSVATLVRLAQKARVDGVLSLESELAAVDDAFLRKGVVLVVDGNDPEVVAAVLETEITGMAARHKAVGGVFMTMGGYAPTLGVLGTVMGLIHMLAQLDNPGDMGGAIAAAFIATLYGVGSANLLFLPIGNKLEAQSKDEQHVREMVLEGILGLQAGDNPLILEERLKAFMSPTAREAERATVGEATDGQEQAAA